MSSNINVSHDFEMTTSSNKYVISVDIGTSRIRVCLYDASCNLSYYTEQAIEILYSVKNETLCVEMDPDKLWSLFQELVSSDLVVAKVDDIREIVSMGISCQRNTFLSWNKDTLEPCHRLITWKDGRAKHSCTAWNKSNTMKLINFCGKLGHFVTRSERFKAAKMFRFLNAMVTHRFLVTLNEDQTMKQLLADRKLAIGCLDTWLIAKLTLGATYVTEPSCSSSTGLFDPYQKDWGHTILKLIHFPVHILPEITDTAGKVIATSNTSVFGVPIQIGAVLGDQQAASFGCGCLKKGSVKISLGTGAFVDFNTGSSPHASMNGLYPLVGWRIDGETTFFAEGCSNDTSTIFEWAKKVGLLEKIEDSSKIASETDPDLGLHFIPAFSGIQTPINDDSACCAFLGIRPETSKAQMIRAMLESIAFRIYQIWKTLLDEMVFDSDTVLRCCGGVSNNDFLCQTISTLLDRSLERVDEPQFASARGAALLAGITSGLWSMQLIENQIKVDRVFYPNVEDRVKIMQRFELWNKAVTRCLNFYD